MRPSTSKVSLTMPDLNSLRGARSASVGQPGTLATSNINMVVINITGAGINNPIVWAVESHSSTGVVIPPVVTIDVPQGTGRLFQVLAMADGMQIFYGETVADTNSSAPSVSINISDVTASTAGLIEGNIVGQFTSTADPGGYTGEFYYMFNPPGGRSPMLVHRGEMFGGWASIYSLGSSILTYQKPDGTALLPGLTNSSLDVFTSTNAARNARVTIPAGWRNESWSGGLSMRQYKQRRVLLGFFGPSATSSTQRVCFDTPASVGTGSQLDRFFATYDPTLTAPPSNPVTWIGRLAPNAVATQAYVESLPVGPSGSSVIGGADNSASCQSTGSAFTDFIPITGSLLTNGDGVGGFRGPFLQVPNQGTQTGISFLNLNYSSALQKITASWKVLPGVAQNLGGFSVFYRKGVVGNGSSDSDLRGGDGYLCNQFDVMGLARLDVVNTATSVDIPGIATWSDANGIQAVVCPRKSAGGYFTSGVSNSFYGNTQFKPRLTNVTTGGVANTLVQNACQQLKFEIVDDQGTPLTVPTGGSVSMTLGMSTPNGAFYAATDTACSGASSQSSPLNIAPGASSVTVGYKPSLNAYTNFSISGGSTGLPPMNLQGSIQIGVIAPTPTTPYKLTVVDPQSAVSTVWLVGSCYPFDVNLSDMSNMPTAVVAGHIVQATLTASGWTGSFFTDSACTTPATTTLLPAMTTSARFYVKPATSAMSAAMVSISTAQDWNGTTGATIPNITALNLNVDDPVVATFAVEQNNMGGGSNFLPYGSGCKPVVLKGKTTHGAYASVTSDTIISVQRSSGFLFYADASTNCGSGGTMGPLSVTIPAMQNQSQPFYVKEDGTSNSLNFMGSAPTWSSPLYLPPPAKMNYRATNPVSLVVGDCEPLAFDFQDSFGAVYSLPATWMVNLSTSGLNLYTNSTCATAASPSVSVTGGLSTVTLFTRPISTATSLSVAGVDYAPGPVNVMMAGWPSVSNVNVTFGPAMLVSGSCYSMTATLTAPTGSVGFPTFTFPISVVSPNMLSLSNTCASPAPTVNLTFGYPGQTTQTFWISKSTTGSVTAAASGTVSPGYLTVAPAVTGGGF